MAAENMRSIDRNKRMRYIVFCGIAAVTVLLNIAAWNSTDFCDWYIAHIFPVWVNTYGRLTGLFPFSVGEWLIVAGLMLVVMVASLAVLWAVVEILSAVQKKRRMGFRRFVKAVYRFFVWTLLAVCLVMTLNCFILYHASTFSQRYFGSEPGKDTEYTLEELIRVYNRVAQQCIWLSGEITRDENGRAVYAGGVGKDGEVLDMADKARELMVRLGDTYDQLDGYYPRPKALLSSDFMCQQYMCGYYFPFSMEANYNDVMYILNIPSTMCHELAHLRGFIYEDEANFIAYLACVESDDTFFQYAGYLSVLAYLHNDLYHAYRTDPAGYEQAAALVHPIAVPEQVWEDDTFVMQEEWERINGKALIDTELVDEVSDIFIDTNLKVNGISDGSVSYSRVVKLLLQYYKEEE